MRFPWVVSSAQWCWGDLGLRFRVYGLGLEGWKVCSDTLMTNSHIDGVLFEDEAPFFVFIYTHTHTHTHIYIYIHTYIHTYVYIYIYIVFFWGGGG